jgi:hypothetical protein
VLMAPLLASIGRFVALLSCSFAAVVTVCPRLFSCERSEKSKAFLQGLKPFTPRTLCRS